MSAAHINDANFKKEVMEEKLPVLADFYADWCSPCKMIAPMIEELGKEYKGKLKVVKIDVEKAPNVAAKFGIMSIPTIILFKNGKVVNQIVGALSKNQLKEKIEGDLSA